MSEKPAPKTTRIRRRGILRSIRAKMAVILLLMAVCFGGFGYLMNAVLEGIDKDMTSLTQDSLPDLTVAGNLLVEAGHTKDNMISLIVAQDMATLDELSERTAKYANDLNVLVASLDEQNRDAFAASASAAKAALDTLSEARRTVLTSDSEIQERVVELHSVSGELREIMAELSQLASVELNKGAVTTYNSIDASLKKLLEVDFKNLQLLLEARSELNLLAGTAVAFGGTKDPVTLEQLTGLADGADARLAEISTLIETNAPELMDVSVIEAAVFTLQSVIAQSLFPSESLRQAAMKARADTDKVIVMAIEAQMLKLTAAAEKASNDNGETLRNLMKNEVGFLNTLMEISTQVSTFQVSALDALTATTEEMVRDAAFDMEGASMNLSFYEDFQDARVGALIGKLDALNDPQTGLPALKINALNAGAQASEASRLTEAAVVEIAERASQLTTGTLSAIDAMAGGISREVDLAKRNLYGAMGIAAAVFLGALLLIQVLILRPLNRVSASTEQLADGDRSPITGFDRASSEIYRIARSLAVFRDGIVAREEMERLAEEERNARMAAQNKAVAALGSGLSRLSEGDLTARIHDELAEGYEQLRIDFNRTLDTLNETVGQVVDTSASIRSGASEISQASQDLSHRTESQAATLEETAAALDQMTASVKSAAEGARDVERTTNEARSEAQASGEIVQNAVSAMTEIEQSSAKISQIISVIDDIAFQTNLLALNAGVEAARAGEAGRGFAVVASEVRGLAQRSSAAALEIKTLISDSSKQVERGVDLVGKAGGALQSILQRVTHISELISTIATGAQEQSTGLFEINTGMNQLDQVTQQNAAMVEEATAAGHLLNTDAQKLAQLVGRFQIEAGARASVRTTEAVPAATAWGDDAGDEWEEATPVPVAETDWSDFNWDDDAPASGAA